MRLKIGGTYRDGWGSVREVMGLAKCGPVGGETVYWTLQGDWYTESGRKCFGERLWHEDGPSSYDLREEVFGFTRPTRKPCVDCKTRKGRLRRACSFCLRPVCNDCYPQKHACKEVS
jgi:hypothetical protein